MFHQVMVDPNDVDALRFLWWPDDDLSKQPVEFRMKVHLFGSVSSPSCASFDLRKTAQENAGDFGHEAVDTVLKNFYVDDCLKSVKSSEVAVELRGDLCALLLKGGFRMTKWLCNWKEVLETIPTSYRAPSVLDLDLNSNVLPTERTLGVQWNMNSDMFTFKMTPKDKPFTRRGILSATSAILIRLAWYHRSSYLRRGFFKIFVSKVLAGMKKSEVKNLRAGDCGCQIYLCFQVLHCQDV